MTLHPGTTTRGPKGTGKPFGEHQIAGRLVPVDSRYHVYQYYVVVAR